MPVPIPSEPLRAQTRNVDTSLHRLGTRELARRRNVLASLLETRCSRAYRSTVLDLWAEVMAEIDRRGGKQPKGG